MRECGGLGGHGVSALTALLPPPAAAAAAAARPCRTTWAHLLLLAAGKGTEAHFNAADEYVISKLPERIRIRINYHFTERCATSFFAAGGASSAVMAAFVRY